MVHASAGTMRSRCVHRQAPPKVDGVMGQVEWGPTLFEFKHFKKEVEPGRVRIGPTQFFRGAGTSGPSALFRERLTATAVSERALPARLVAWVQQLMASHAPQMAANKKCTCHIEFKTFSVISKAPAGSQYRSHQAAQATQRTPQPEV
eukprot:1157980-Pelagomonas_calceolata.AAC.1